MTLHNARNRLCAPAQLLVLAAGALFYVCARGAHPLTTVPAVWGSSLPTLLHSAAFALLALAVTAPWPRLAPWVCGGWLAVEAGFELFQLESVARIANVDGPDAPWLRAFLAGTFDRRGRARGGCRRAVRVDDRDADGRAARARPMTARSSRLRLGGCCPLRRPG